MKPLVVLLALIVMLIAMTPALVANPAAQPQPPSAGSVIADSTQHPGNKQDAESPASAKPARKERARRGARIDLTMPFYRFGRLPIRIKD